MRHQVASWIVCLFVAGSAHAQESERITSFHSDITVQSDASMTVRETIRVVALGQQIRRGIYRDFPTTYRDARGNRVSVRFDIVSVVRDGEEEGYHTERLSNGVRIYFGRENYFLPQGEHTFEFTYRTTRQLGFFDDHDELYWNVTGNGWPFSIDEASAKVTLPEGVAETEISLEAYTGAQGAKGQDFESHVVGPSQAAFATTRPLGPSEGLTIVVSFPKRIVTEPSLGANVAFAVRQNAGPYIILGGTLSVLVFYVVAWLMVGVDPARGAVLPREEPPEGFSAPALRFIQRMGPDPKSFSVALISMGVKRYLRVEQSGRHDYAVIRNEDADDQVLNDEERAVAAELFSDGDQIQLTDANHGRIGRAQLALYRLLIERFRGEYFRRNGGLLFLGMVLTAGTIVGGFVASGEDISWMHGVGVIALIAINVLFGILLRAPTRKGRTVLDELEGFKMYLNGGGTARFSASANPDEMGRRFEKFLPYAIALGAESEWAEGFTRALQTKPRETQMYSPVWYHSDNWKTAGAAGFARSLSGTFASVVASSSSPPGSSSGGGGGGSSGGGGGGGGGGGW